MPGSSKDFLDMFTGGQMGSLGENASMMNKMNPFDNLFPDNRVDYTSPDGTIQKVNPDFLKLIMNRPDLKERFDRTGSIYSDMP